MTATQGALGETPPPRATRQRTEEGAAERGSSTKRVQALSPMEQAVQLANAGKARKRAGSPGPPPNKLSFQPSQEVPLLDLDVEGDEDC